MTSAKGDVQRTIRSSFLWAAVGQGGFFVLQFASSIALARLLTPYELGIFAIALAAVGMVSAFQSLGLSNYIVRAESVHKDVLSSVFTVNLIMAGVISLAIMMFGMLGQYIFSDPGVRSVLFLIAVIPLVDALALVPSSLLQREGNFKILSVARLVSMALGTICTVTLAFAGFSYMSLAYGGLLTAVAISVATCFLAARHVHFRTGLRHWRDITKFGARMIMINGVVQLQGQAGNFALGTLSGLASLGLYSRANNLYNLLFDNVHTVLARVLIADFAAIARSGGSLRDRYIQVLEFMTALLWPAFAGMAVLAGPMVQMLYGPKWHALALPLSVLCLNGILWVSVTMAWELFVVSNETARQARFEIIRSALGLTLFVAGAMYSLTGAVIGRVAEGVFAVFLYQPHIRRMTESCAGDFIPVYIRSLVLTAVAVFPSMALMVYRDWDPATPMLQIAAAILLGGASWVFVLYRQDHPILREVLRLVRNRKGMTPSA
jgi:O-antigen/teichoic acid export membrane protein